MKFFDVVGYSTEWWELRRGVPTASEFGRVLSPAKAEPSRGAEGYIRQLVEELSPAWLPPVVTERPATPAMRHGVECEPEARAFYSLLTGNAVSNGGFVATDDGRFGCSPDGLVVAVDCPGSPNVGCLELKCVQPGTQAAYLLYDDLPREHKCQVHGQLIVTGLPWVDFLSYCPGMDPLLVRVCPDDFTKKLKTELDVFYGRLCAAREKAFPKGVVA